MNGRNNEITDSYVGHIAEGGRMEKWVYEHYQKDLEIWKFPSCLLRWIANVQIRSYMLKKQPDITHQFDVWHVRKSIKKALF